MTWVRLEPNAPTHPKIIRIGIAGFGLFVAGLCYANHYLTDGLIPTTALAAVFPGITPRRALALAVTLVEAGLWEVADGGWRIHDFHHYQPSAALARAEAAARHAAKVDAGRMGGIASGVARSRNEADAKQNGLSASSKDEAKRSSVSDSVSDTKPELQRKAKTPRADARYTPGFEAFWLKYPKRVGKDDAWKAWGDRICEPVVDDVLGGLERQWAYLHREDGKWIPNPATWLRAGRWKDEPPVTNGLRLSPKTREMIGAGQAWIERTVDDQQ